MEEAGEDLLLTISVGIATDMVIGKHLTNFSYLEGAVLSVRSQSGIHQLSGSCHVGECQVRLSVGWSQSGQIQGRDRWFEITVQVESRLFIFTCMRQVPPCSHYHRKLITYIGPMSAKRDAEAEVET